MVNVEGPDGRNYAIHFARNKKIEDILFHCTNRKIGVYEGNFPWIKRRRLLGGYKAHLQTGWKAFGTAVRGGFFVHQNAYLHSELPDEEKLALAFHELAHIIEGHEEGRDLETERETTILAISMVEKNKNYLRSAGLNPNKIIRSLRRRLDLYRKKGI